MNQFKTGEFSHHALLVIFTFFWGANFILAEIALKEMAPISFSVSRFGMGGVAMVGILYLQGDNLLNYNIYSGKIFPHIEKSDWYRLILVSILGATLAPWLGIEGLKLTHGARASLWLALGPAISTGIGYLMSTEKMGSFGYTGVVLAGLGTLVLAYNGFLVEGYWAGDLLLCAALAMTVMELHLIKPLANKYGSLRMVALRTVIGGSIYIAIASPSLVQEPWLTFGMWTWIAILAGGLIGVGMGQWIKVRALHKLGPTQVVIYGNLVPVAALVIAWLSIGQDPTFYELIAGALIITGALFIQVIDAPRKDTTTVTEQEEFSIVTGPSQE